MKKTKDVSPLDGFSGIIDSINAPSHEEDVAKINDIDTVEDPDDVKDLSFSQDTDEKELETDDKTKVTKPEADKNTAEIEEKHVCSIIQANFKLLVFCENKKFGKNILIVPKYKKAENLLKFLSEYTSLMVEEAKNKHESFIISAI